VPTHTHKQIRRGIHRLQDALGLVEKNTTSLQTNCLSVLEEVDEIYRRLQKALKDRTEHLRGEIDKYMTTEMKNLCTLRENLEQEIGNIQSNCDLADKYMTDAIEWDDCELMDTKEIFMKTVEFMRNFEYENSDYNRRVRFQMAIDPNQLVMTVANHGDLNIAPHSSGASPSQSGLLAPPGPALMRSKSDHRLATQFRQQESQGFGVNTDDEPLLGGRRFGERPVKVASAAADARHSRGSEYDYDYENEPSSRTGKGRFRSRFVKSHHADTESDTESTKSTAVKEKEKDKIISTEDTSKGPLSGIFRIADSPRVMKRLQEQEMGKKEKKEAAPPQKPAAQMPKRPVAPVTARQLSEDDEIARIKRQNKGATSTAPITPPVAVQVVDHSERPASERVTALKSRNTTASDDSDHSTPSSPVRRTPPEVSFDED
jgi:tripartite motif-containing protein 71